MMRAHVNQQSSEEDEITHMKIQQIKKRTRHALIAIILYLALIFVIVGYRYYDTKEIVEDGRFYRSIKQFQKRDTVPNSPASKEGTRTVTNQQLGKMSWTLLHMASGAFPAQFDEKLQQKFMAFLILFGQLYPCKQCGQLFLEILQQLQPPSGNTKNEIMVYLCQIHNKMNEHIGQPRHSCSNVKKQWNTCGCSES